MVTRKILLCATDAGGAGNIVPLLNVLDRKGFQSILAITKPLNTLFKVNVFGTESISAGSITSEKMAFHILEKIKPFAVICGTTRYIGAERFLTLAAKIFSIRSVVVLDEWFNYHLRFQDENGNLFYLPDIICCQDQQAKKEAEAEGIPSQLLNVTGSPYLSNLTDKAQQFAINEPEIPDFIKSYVNEQIVTFLSETHTSDYGSASGKQGPLGSFIGYTEHSVKNEVITVLKRLNRQIVFIEKLHPGAEGLDFQVSKQGKITLIRIKQTDLWKLLYYSDVVLGMRSMALLESCILGRPTVSYQPGLIGPQLCTAVRLGIISCLSQSSKLEDWLRQKMNITIVEKEKLSVKRYPFAASDAVERIAKLAIEGMVSSN